MNRSDVDVLIVGAGLSGVAAAYYLQTQCPRKSYEIIEARERLGGTWDLFRYPGIRSDSDMYTLGYTFRPWSKPQTIADGGAILDYIRETSEHYGIDRHIVYQKRIEKAEWSSEKKKWTVTITDTSNGTTLTKTCSFLFLCVGYYDYDQGYTPDFQGRDQFRGQIIHPQFWPEDLDYNNKRVVVIGSGATAVTLVPSLAQKAAHVTMLQRSPTYILSIPSQDPLTKWIRTKLPTQAAYRVNRTKNVLLGMGIYAASRRFPEQMKNFLVGQIKKMVGDATDVEKHFMPHYNPWDQRLCLVPDADLFRAIAKGRASVVTDQIEKFNENGLLLKSGEQLEADIVVTATDLKLKAFGNIGLTVDGQKVDVPNRMLYKGTLISDVPNLAVAIGYTNASWTLRCELICEYVCRLLNHMDTKHYAICRPRQQDAHITEEPLLGLTAGYVQRAAGEFPKQGEGEPWKLRQNYLIDRTKMRHSAIEDRFMQFA